VFFVNGFCRDKIREYKDESERLDQCSRLYDSSISNVNFELDASHIAQVRKIHRNIHFLGFFLSIYCRIDYCCHAHNQKIIVVLTDSLTHDVASRQSERVENIF
jgi:hypothetical protein